MDGTQDKSQGNYERKFILIPHEIFADPELTHCDKLIYGRINSFEVFFESATKTAELLRISERQVKRSKQALEARGYIRCVEESPWGKKYTTNGEKLHEMRMAEGCQNGTGGVTNWPGGVTNWTGEYKGETKKENIKEKQTKEKKGSEPQQFGNPDINALLDAWAEATGFDLKNQKMERYAMSGLIKSHGLEATRALVERVKRARRSDDRFAPQIAKPSQLRGKYSKLEALTLWEERSAKQAEAERKASPARLYPTGLPDYCNEPTIADTPEARAERHRIAQEVRKKFFERIGGGSND